MTRTFASLALLLGLSLAGCASELDDKTAATVQDAPAAAPATPPAAAPAAAPAGEAVTLAFDGSSSKLEWLGRKVTKDHPGGFSTFSGTAELVGGQVQSVKVDIQLDSLYTDSEKLVSHLKSPDFFEVEKYATATFTSTSITAGGEGGSHTVTGTLDLHGAQKQLTFPANIHVMDGKAHVSAEFTIDRQQWGINYPGKPDDLIRDEVLIKLDVNLAPKAS